MILICTIDELQLHLPSKQLAASMGSRVILIPVTNVVLWAIQNALVLHSDFRLDV
jgi:hypothetical protein